MGASPAEIERACYAASRDGPFVRLRNRAWFLDRRRELPGPLVARWRSLLRGSSAERMEVDLIEFSGPGFARLDNRLMSLTLVHSGFAPETDNSGLYKGWLNFMSWLKSMVEIGAAT